MTKDEAIKLAIDALKLASRTSYSECNQDKFEAAIAALREALDEPEQEPVALVTGIYGGRFTVAPINAALALPVGMALFTAPPRREWVGLTDDEIDQAFSQAAPTLRKIYQVIEAKLKELNHAQD